MGHPGATVKKLGQLKLIILFFKELAPGIMAALVPIILAFL